MIGVARGLKCSVSGTVQLDMMRGLVAMVLACGSAACVVVPHARHTKITFAIDGFSPEQTMQVESAMADLNSHLVRYQLVVDSAAPNRIVATTQADIGGRMGWVHRTDAGVKVDLAVDALLASDDVRAATTHELMHIVAKRNDHLPDGPALMTPILSSRALTLADIAFCGEECEE